VRDGEARRGPQCPRSGSARREQEAQYCNRTAGGHHSLLGLLLSLPALSLGNASGCHSRSTSWCDRFEESLLRCRHYANFLGCCRVSADSSRIHLWHITCTHVSLSDVMLRRTCMEVTGGESSGAAHAVWTGETFASCATAPAGCSPAAVVVVVLGGCRRAGHYVCSQ